VQGVVAGVVLGLAIALLPITLSRFHQELVGTYLTYSFVALGLGVTFGYCGILSLAQFAFFGIGAYAVALLTTRVVGFGPEHVPLLVLAATALAGAFGFLVAYVSFSLRIGSLFVLVTITVGILLQKFTSAQLDLLGGINGIALPRWIVPGPGGGFLQILIVLLAAVFFVLWLAVRAPFGKVMAGVRDAEGRVESLGYNTTLVKSITFGLSAAAAGLGGALYAVLTGFVTPSVFGFVQSFNAVIWVVVGGVGTLVGPLVGTILVNFAQFYLSSWLLNYWTLVVGFLFVVVVLFFPRGVVGTITRTGTTWMAALKGNSLRRTLEKRR
jgi:ABC-type branched-subunit amino acid transport system permease subunit